MEHKVSFLLFSLQNIHSRNLVLARENQAQTVVEKLTVEVEVGRQGIEEREAQLRELRDNLQPPPVQSPESAQSTTPTTGLDAPTSANHAAGVSNQQHENLVGSGGSSGLEGSDEPANGLDSTTTTNPSDGTMSCPADDPHEFILPVQVNVSDVSV